MDSREQDWIDKYRAATADAKPAEGGGLNKFIRRIAIVIGGALGRARNKNRATLLTILPPSAIPPREVLKAIKEDDAA
jgi:hypothetical protein